MIIARPKEAAEMLRIGTKRIYELLESGELPAYRDGTYWSIPIPLITEYAEARALREAEERREHGDK